jgi:hypothetical protein
MKRVTFLNCQRFKEFLIRNKISESRVITALILIICLNGCIRSYCGAVEDFKRQESCSIVLKKDSLKWNHNEPMLRVKDFCGDGFKVNGDVSGFFEYVQVGDSLSKPKDSFKVAVFREGKKVAVYKMDFGCR